MVDFLSSANKIDNGAGPAADRQINRPAADGAVFDDGLLRLRSIDFQRETLAAMRAGNFGLNAQVHLGKL
jgi:hypothetical protein